MDTAAPPQLTALAKLLRRRPPSLADLAAILRYSEDYKWFGELVGEFLPEEAEALAAIPNMNVRVSRFSSVFSRKYFPIYTVDAVEWGDEEPACSLLRHGIPFQLYGMAYEDRHELWEFYRPELAALTLLSGPPAEYVRFYFPELEGLRVSWLESAAEHIPTETLERIPADGIEMGALVKATKGTRFAAAGQQARWLWNETDNFFLDYSYSDGIEIEDPWDRDVIEHATCVWRKAQKIIDEVETLADWLAKDLPTRFGEMLEDILVRLEDLKEIEDGE